MTMRRKTLLICCDAFLILILFTSLYGQGIIINHIAVEQFDQIPPEWIIAAKQKIKLHYQYRSHGSQLIKGAERIETSLYNITRQEEALPADSMALNIYEDTYPAECQYWDEDPPYSSALNKCPEINVSLWAWCTELNRKPQQQMKAYFNGMRALEAKYPQVRFVYMTGNAQAWSGHHTYNSDSEGHNRYLDNELIRKFCADSNRVLYDFGDIDAWYHGERATSVYEGKVFPREHDRYNIEEAGHTSWENCEHKAKAFWYLMAVLAGWKPPVTPVELVVFKGRAVGSNVELTWQTASESNNYGFEIERSFDCQHFQKIAFVLGNATTNQPKSYYFLDHDPPRGIVSYRLRQIDFDGTVTHSAEISMDLTAHSIRSFKLDQNYPNPFNPMTSVSYTVPTQQWITLKIFDLNGREVSTLVDAFNPPGEFRVIFDASKLGSGEYLYLLKAGNVIQTRKMLLVK